MTVVTSQRRTFLEIVAALRPHWRRDRNLPDRIRGVLGADRRLGSRDRRLYRELLYTTLRFLPWVDTRLDADPDGAVARVAWLAAETPDTSAFRREITATWPPTPDRLQDRARALGERVPDLLPAWVEAECPAAFEPEEMEALHRRGPLWLRAQTDDAAGVFRELESSGWEVAPSEVIPGAARLLGPRPPGEADLTRLPAFAAGRFEIQDLGSQLILASVGIAPGERWLDACAGAGGKSLQLARLLGAEGSVDAYDIRTGALDELALRVDRAALRNVRILRPSSGPVPWRDGYDGILVDAPCSGSGTWRRAPFLKWITTPAELEVQAERQRRLLADFASRVRPGGTVVYATCSLFRSENEGVVRRFLKETPEFESVRPARDFGTRRTALGVSILPARHDTDGYYMAVLRRRR